MAWTSLKALVAEVIKTNNQGFITAPVMQAVLIGIINQLGSGATFKGVADLSTFPTAQDSVYFYIAAERGTYENFGSLNVGASEIAVFYYNGTEWSKMGINLTDAMSGKQDLLVWDSEPTADSANPVTSSGVKAYVDSRLTSVYRLIGTVQFASIPTSGVSIGDVYNISDAFITTPDFAEGAGIHCPAGTNIAYDNNNKWDLLGGAFNIEYATNSDIDAMFV